MSSEDQNNYETAPADPAMFDLPTPEPLAFPCDGEALDTPSSVSMTVSMPDGYTMSDFDTVTINGVEFVQADARIAELEAEAKKMIRAAKAYQELRTLYRTGRRPRERFFRQLDEAKKILASAEAANKKEQKQ